MQRLLIQCCVISFLLIAQAPAQSPLDLGIANHAFDHLGDVGDQANAAAQAGATIIYTTGVGAAGYAGLPPAQNLQQIAGAFADYVKDARHRGIRTVIGYVCATSIVHLDTFDKDWSADFRAQFKTSPSDWLQQDKSGHALKSWYGGDYSPACMNNPDWRTYEKSIVRKQLESGCDGIFFDNPTVHEQGCYCEHCMKKFAAFIGKPSLSTGEARQETTRRAQDFAQFRCTTARDFLADIRTFARTIKPDALITCNNSLNSPDVFFSQARGMAYNIFEMSKTEDYVTLEDMTSQPRTLANGQTIEYGPVYDAVEAISHQKPVVAVTIADGDYHTPPNLTKLAMAEAAAHGASYLMWPTWPEDQRERMIAAIKPESDFLRDHADLLNGTTVLTDAIVFLPFRQWTQTTQCKPLQAARELARRNIQYKIVDEDDLPAALDGQVKTLIIESPKVLTPSEERSVQSFKSKGGKVVSCDSPDWLHAVESSTIDVTGPPTVRAIVRQNKTKTILHLLNLNIAKVSSFEDRVEPARNVQILLHLPRDGVRSVHAFTAGQSSPEKNVDYELSRTAAGFDVKITVPRLDIATMLVIE